MKNDNQAAVDLFSNYSEFMLTDDELLAIHGGATQSGHPSTGSGPDASSAPPPAIQVSPQIDPLDRAVEEVARDVREALQFPETIRAIEDAIDHVVHAVEDFFSGSSSQASGTGG